MTIAIITEAGVRKVAPLVVVAQQSAALASQMAAISTAVASERYFASYAAGNSATSPGQYFAVLGLGVYDFYLHGTGTPVVSMPVLNGSGYFAGNIGFGVAPVVRLHVKGDIGASQILRLETQSARGSGSNYVGWYDPTGRAGYYGWGAVNNDLFIVNEIAGDLIFSTAGSNIQHNVGGATMTVTQSAGFRPGSDNQRALGAASFRWSVVYSATGSINTSDAREKTDKRALTVPELAAAKRIAASIGVFQFIGRVRDHVGVVAQEVWGIMADEGLIDPISEGETPSSPYAFLCYDEWDATPAVPPVEAVEEELDEEGNILVAGRPAIPGQEGREAGNRFSIRPDELALFLIAAQEARLAALET